MEPAFSLLPKFKACLRCTLLTNNLVLVNKSYFFSCFACGYLTPWTANTCLSKAKLSFNSIERLITLFLDSKSAKEAHDILNYYFVEAKININTVRSYFELFNRIVYDFVDKEMGTKMLGGEIEIDETHLFKEKKSSAPHRPYKYSSQ